MNECTQKIRGYLAGNLGIDLSGCSDADPLFSSGLIDSFALIELLAFMEEELGAEIDISELQLERIDTIEALAALSGTPVG